MPATSYNNKGRNSRRVGFSLVEAMFAVLVLAFAITMMMPVTAAGLERLREMKMRETAVWLAGREMEALRLQQSDVSQGFSSVNSVSKQNAQISPLKKEVSVTDRSSTLKEVTVMIYWPSARDNSVEHSISLMTLISKNGVNQ